MPLACQGREVMAGPSRFGEFKLESLILAQNERWRRA